MYAGGFCAAREEIHGGVDVEKGEKIVRSEAADAGLRADTIESAFPFHDERRELRAEFEPGGNFRFRRIFAEGAEAVAHTYTDAEVVGDLAGAGDKAGSGRGCEIPDGVRIAADLKASDQAGSGVKLDAAAQVHEEIGGRAGGESQRKGGREDGNLFEMDKAGAEQAVHGEMLRLNHFPADAEHGLQGVAALLLKERAGMARKKVELRFKSQAAREIQAEARAEAGVSSRVAGSIQETNEGKLRTNLQTRI